MLTKLAKWWLNRSGHVVVPPTFFGIVLGGCHAFGSRKQLMVMMDDPNYEFVVINHSILDLSHTWPHEKAA